MEATKFLNILKKHKYSLIAIPILIMGIAFMLVRKQPNVYMAKGSMAAGLVENSQTSLLDKSLLQESKINQQFSNLIQMMQMKQVYDQISYQLILHDLTTTTPFKKPSKLLETLNEDARKHAVETYFDHYNQKAALSTWDKDQKGLNEVLKSMGYDYASLSKKLKVYRIENSDFITVEYESDSPMLSAYVVNSLCKEFIQYYTSLTKDNQYKAIQFLDTMMQQKKDSLNDQVGGLKNFKIQNHVLNLSEYAKTLYTQIADLEGRIQQVKKEIDANKGALENINKKFSSNGRQYSDTSQITLNQKIVALKEQMTSTYDEYAKSSFDPKYKVRMDSLKQILDREINRSIDRAPLNPLEAKANLISQKMNLEINLDLATSSIKSLQDEYTNLNRRLNALVPYEAVIQSYEGNISVASQEYIEVLKKYNQTSLAYNSGVQLRQIEMAMPGEAQPSKKMLVVGLSGVGSFAVMVLILFVLFYLDDSIQFAEELANKTNFAVLGLLPLINNSSLLNLNQLWEYDNGDPENKFFKNQLRSVRFETDDVLKGSQMLTVTSLSQEEGKTFLSMSLASAYIMVNKKVLLIDGNFNDPAITRLTKTNDYIEDYLTDKASTPRPSYDNDITVLGNKGMDTSLFEISNEKNVREKMENLKYNFDIIIIEASSLNTLNQAKEWINVSEKVIAVFESNKSLAKSDQQFLAYLKSQNDKFIGWIFNKVRNMENNPAGKKRWFRKN